MARKRKETEVPEIYKDINTSNMLRYSSGRYSKEVVLNRALPDARDGLKPVQRKIIYAMFKGKARSKDKHVKVAKISGNVMGDYHPHGDLAIDKALTRMSKEWVMNVPLIDIDGNNGNIDGDPAAASRYIEARMFEAAEHMVRSIEYGTVEMVDNYDGTTKEPVVFPAEWPVLFTNGTQGMAVGFATNVASHNVNELMRAAILLNKEPDATLSSVMKKVKGPDFPTGGIIMGKEGVKELYKTGKGSFKIRGKATIDEKKNDIVITEIPYGVKKKELVDTISKAIVNNNLKHQLRSSMIIDESQDEYVRIVIEVKKGCSAENMLNFLYKKTKLEVSFAGNHVALIDNVPQNISLIDYLKEFLRFRKECVRKEYEFEHNVKSKRLHLVEGFIKMIDISEEVIKEIKKSKGRSNSAKAIEKKFGFSKEQSEAIVDMRLFRINSQDLNKLLKEKDDLGNRIKWIEDVLSDSDLFRDEIERLLKETMNDFSKFKRRSQIHDEVIEAEVDMTSLIHDENVSVVIKTNGIQRMSNRVFENNKDKVESGFIRHIDSSTARGIAAFTKKGLVMQRIIEEVENSSVRNDVDPWQKTTKTFSFEDEIISAIDFDMGEVGNLGLSVISLTEKGQLKFCDLDKCLLSFNKKSYLTRTKPFNGMKIEGDEISFVDVVKKEDIPKIWITVKKESGGRGSRKSLSEIKEQGNTGSGISVIKVPEGDRAVVSNSNLESYSLLN